MAERALSTDIKKLLLNNEAFTYAHLVKFERPSKELLNGTFSTDAKRYAYYTDSTFNVDFNDASLDTLGNANGSQTYVADKILEVGTYSETVEAKASGMNIKLSSETLNNSITNSAITMTSSTITVPAHIDLANEGFREGDKVLISGGANNGHEVRVIGIKTNNTVLVVSNIDSTLGTQSTGTSITLKIVSDELSGPLTEINDSGSLKSYHNREVFVYKAFLDGATIVGDPVLIFKGIIQSASMAEAPDKNLQVTWNLTSHWGDFAQVKGRMSNDKIHRAVDSENRGQEKAALRPEYANDLGFMHAEQTTNILATYTAIEQEMKVKVKKKWFGFKTKVTTEMVDVEVQRDVNLDFSLSSHFIPVVYGIDRIQGKPIFVDTKSNDPNNIFIAYSLCEGQIGGLYDLYIDGNPLVCINKEDSDDRNDATGASKDNVEVFCRGRQDLGTTLGGVKMSGSGVSGSNRANYGYRNSFAGYGRGGFRPQQDYIEAQDVEYFGINESLLNVTANDANGGGVLDGETVKLSAPNTMRLTLHTGKKDQKADDTLTSIAVSPKFKRQVDYFNSSEEEGEYWSPAHKLLDTAYVVLDCEIAEDATTVPEIEYVVRGKSISCYNYDYSYDHTGASGQAHTNFNVGDKVTLKRTSDNSTLNANVIIIDKWSFADTEGNLRYRFRYSTAPNLNYSDGIPQITAFYHTDGTNSWNMVTYNHEAETGTVPATLSVTTTVTANTGSALTANTGSNPAWLNNPYLNGAHFNFFFEDIDLPYFRKNFPFTLGGTTLTATGTNAEGATGGSQTLVSADKIKLGSGANSSDNAYNGYTVELTKTFTDSTGTQKQKVERVISAYDGSERVATVTAQWPAGMAPDPDDVVQESGAVYTYRLLPKSTLDDKRVSINPAIQLLDYMTAKTYGKDLDIDTDIAMSDFLLSARACDDKGTQTLVGLNTLPTVGDRYVLTSDGTTSGSVVAMGLVKSVGTYSNNVKYAVMQQCFGKFSKRFMAKTHSYSVGDIIYTGHANGYTRVTSAGTINSSPVGNLTSIPLFKLVNGAATSTSFTVSNNNGGYYNYVGKYNATTGAYDTGYSIFDSDNVQYWRYLGWNSHHQREVTRHQCMGSVDTSQSVFANINGFLKNFNGMLSYEAGQYALRIETTSDSITSQIATSSDTGYTVGAQKNARWIDESDIIGNISVKDGGTKKSYNTVSTSIEDPGNQFKNTAVTFYDSNYLRADKNVIKTGTVAIPAVASYYNARINVENFLRKSRFGLSISFTMGPKALMLLAGETIAFSHEKFGWYGKKFRITNISYNKNCNANITAEEYDDSFYTITAPSLPSVSGNDQRQGLQASPGVPGSPTATAGALGTINVTWTNNTVFTDNMFTEVWSGPDSNVNNRTLLTKTDGATAKFADNVGSDNTERYYWIRHGKRVVLTSGGQNKVKVLYSNFVGPDNATTVIPSTWYKVAGSSNFGAFKFSADGNTKTPSAITITADRINLSAAASFTATNNSGASVTLTGSGDTRSLTSANFGSATFVNVTISVTSTTAERNAGADDTYTDVVSIQKIQDGLVGSNGNDAKTVKLTADDYSIVYNAAGSSPSPSSSITLTATAQGFTDPYFKFTGDGISDEGTFTDGSGGADTFTFSVPSSHFTTPKSLRVGVSEADQTEVAFDTISLFAVKPGQQGVDGAEPVTKEFTVTVAGGKFVINGTSQKELTLLRGFTYTFDQSASSNSSHPIRFSTTSNGTHGGGSAYTSGVTHTGTPGSSGALTTFKVPSDAPASLYYYCSNHSGMGGEVNTQDLGSGVTIICTNESHAIPADNDGGNPVMTGSGTSFEVFRGNTQLTGITSGTPGADQFKVTVTSDTNITAGAQSASSQAIVFADHTSMSAGTANIVYSVNIENTQTVTKKQTFSRTNKGNTGDQGDAGLKIAEVDLYYELSAGSYVLPNSAPSTGTYNFGTDTVASIPSGWSQTKPAVKVGQIAAISKTIATESTSGGGVSGSLTWTTPTMYSGGTPTTDFIFKYMTAAGSAPSATAYNGALPTGWSTSIPTNPNDGKKLFSSKGVATLSGSYPNFGFNFVWQTPVLQVQGKTDVGLGSVVDERQITIFRQTSAPTALAIGDIWFDTDDGNRIYRAESVGADQVTAGEWVSVLDDGAIRARGAIDSSNRITGGIYDGSNIFSPADLLRVKGSFDGIGGTPVLKLANANAGLKNSGITMAANGTLTGGGTSVQVNLNSIPDAGNTRTYAGYAGAGLDSSGNLTAGIKSGGTTFSAAEAVNVRGAFDSLSGTPALKVDNANAALKNATIAINTNGQLTGIGTGVNTIISNTKIVEADIVGSGKTFTGGKPNKTEFQSGSVDGAIQFKNDGAGSFTNLTPFSAAELQKLTNLRGGKVPGDGSGSTTALIGNDEIAINTTTGVLSGIGTGNSSRVFNDVIGVSIATSGVNQGRITVAGIGASNTTVDVTKGNLGLNYTDGADVTSSNTAANVTNVGNQTVANAQQAVIAANAGLTTTGDVNRAVPTGKGGTGETNTNKFLNSGIAISQGNSGVFTLTKGDGTTDTTTITKTKLGLSYTDGADVTSSNTAANVTNVGNQTVANAQDGIVRARAGLATNGDVDRAVPTGKGGTGETNTNKFLNSGIAISQGNSGVFTLTKGDGTTDTTTITKTKLGLSYTDGADVTGSNTANNVTNVGNQTVANAQDGIVRARAGLATNGDVNRTVPRAKGGFGQDVGTLFGTTAGRFPRWNGSAFEVKAESDLLNSNVNQAFIQSAITDFPAFRTRVGAGTSSFAGTQAAIEAAITNASTFRSSVGAGTSSFSGSAADLSGTLSSDRLGVIPVSKGGTALTSLSTLLNSNITSSNISTAGGVLGTALTFGSITYSSGGTCSFFSTNNGSTYASTNATGTLSITHPTLGTFSCTYTWTRSSGNISAFALTNTGSGNDAWTSSSFGSAATAKTITVTHTASSKTISVTASVTTLNLGSGGGGPSGGGCFLPGTLVEMADGTEQEIQKIKIGQEVKGGLVTNKSAHNVNHWYKLNDLKLTGGHPIWIEGKGWSCINPQDYYDECEEFGHSVDLQPNKIEMGSNTTNGEIKLIEKIEENVEVWNITVDRTHTYYVNKILVHNASKP